MKFIAAGFNKTVKANCGLITIPSGLLSSNVPLHFPSASPFNNTKVIFFSKAFECRSIYMYPLPLRCAICERHADCELIDPRPIKCGGRRHIWGGALQFLAESVETQIASRRASNVKEMLVLEWKLLERGEIKAASLWEPKEMRRNGFCARLLQSVFFICGTKKLTQWKNKRNPLEGWWSVCISSARTLFFLWCSSL